METVMAFALTQSSRGPLQWFRDWRAGRAAVAELDRLPASEVARLAADAGVDASGLRGVAAKGVHAADLLLRRLRSLGLDPDAIAVAQAAVFRDLQRVCAYCGSKRRCARDLDRNVTARWPSYCPNAETLRMLTAKSTPG
jgi:hypothetical protein